MMADIVLDTNILVDVLAQYYEESFRERSYFKTTKWLSRDLVRRLNRILDWHLGNDDSPYPGLIVASSFAFVEIARQFEAIATGRFTVAQFAAFINQPPEWFFIAAVDSTLLPYLCGLPREISLLSGDVKPIEWTDAIHIATALSRDEPRLLAVTDARIREVELLQGMII